MPGRFLVRSASIGVALTAVLGLVTPVEADPVPSPEECATELYCDLDVFTRMPIDDRIAFVHLVQRQASDFEPGFRRWMAVVGVLKAARDHGVGEPGTWVAITGAGLLEGIERGTAVAGPPQRNVPGNPGTARWAGYLEDLNAGELDHPPTHDRVWSNAEQVSLDHGAEVAEEYGVRPTEAERRFKMLTDLGRYALRNQDELSVVLGPLAPVLWWFTDTRNEHSYRLAGEVVTTLAFGPPNVDSLTELLRGIQQRCPSCTRPAPAG